MHQEFEYIVSWDIAEMGGLLSYVDRELRIEIFLSGTPLSDLKREYFNKKR